MNLSEPPELSRLLTSSELAELLRIKPQSLRRMRWSGNSPPFLPGRRVLYDPADVAQWLAGRKRRSTSDDGRGAA